MYDVKVYDMNTEANRQLSPHLQVHEFACTDGSSPVFLSQTLVDILENIRVHFGQPLHLTDGSGCRMHRRRRDEWRVDAPLRERAVEHAQALGVVRMVVRDEHGRERERVESHGVAAFEQRLLRDAAVDEDGGVAQPNEGGIALAAAGEHVQHEAVGIRRSVHVAGVRGNGRAVGVRKIVRIVSEKSVRIVSVGKDTRATSTRTAACARGTVRRFSRSGRILREHSARNAIRSPMRRAFRRSVLRAHALDMLARKGLALAPCIELPLSRRTRSVHAAPPIPQQGYHSAPAAPAQERRLRCAATFAAWKGAQMAKTHRCSLPPCALTW